MSRRIAALTKLTVVVSALLALCVETRMGAFGWPPLTVWTIGAFAASAIGVRMASRVTWWVLLGCAVVVPVIFLATLGDFFAPFHAVWFAGMLGALLGSRAMTWSDWRFPQNWRAPLACWATVVAVTWPLAAWREADFATSFSAIGGFGANALSGLGGPPVVIVGFMSTMVLAHLVGMLWFEHACDEATRGRRYFRSVVITPLAAGALVAAGLACYQGSIDVFFLNTHQWPALGRAGGSLLDGDAAGALMGMWAAAFFGLALGGSRRWLVVGLLGAALSWGGLWATGSRMALLTGLIGLAALGLALLKGVRRSRLLWFPVGILVAGAVTFAVARQRTDHNDPLSRIRAELPAPTLASVKEFAVSQLFDRTAPFGTVSVDMMRRFPVAGVGIGSFETMFSDFAFVHDGHRYAPDNAQSWYRHQLAETGMVGSVGWCVWLVMVVLFVMRTVPIDASARAEGAMIRATLLAIAIVGVVAMPTRSVFVGFSVWLFLAWYRSLVIDVPADAVVRARASTSTAAWIAVLIVAVSSASATIVSARSALRPASRALMASWNYEYGLYPVEHESSGRAFRWLAPHAIEVFPLSRMAWVRIAMGGGPPDIATKPFGLQVKIQGIPLIAEPNFDGRPHEWYVQTFLGERDLQIEVQTSRAWSPADSGGKDDRLLGVWAEPWTIVDGPPHGAHILGRLDIVPHEVPQH